MHEYSLMEQVIAHILAELNKMDAPPDGSSMEVVLRVGALAVLGYLRERFANTRVVDPANHRNAISDDLLLHERLAIADAAAATLKQSAWDRIVWVTA